MNPPISYIRDANRRYLIDRQGGIYTSVIPNVGNGLGFAGAGFPVTQAPNPVGTAISNAWSSYATSKYDKVISLQGGYGG